MKRILTILAVVLLTASVFAQAPQKMSYQAVIRNSSNALVISHTVGMKISILQGSSTGTAVYTETQTPTTNANGLVTIEIGSGAGFNTIDWSNGTYFIKTETDPAGGTTYTIEGTSQLLSVPYALYANNGITTAEKTKLAGLTSGSHYLGEDYLGGIIYHLYYDNTGMQKGLIVSKTESTAIWGSSNVGTNTTSDGAFNTNLMPTAVGTARTWVETLGAGWYLPSIDELGILYRNRFHVNNSSASGLTLLSISASYWSSTEYNGNGFFFPFYRAYPGTSPKTDTYSVRAVRAF